jgi:glycosyltransferase involved in cell wall biosynthesis
MKVLQLGKYYKPDRGGIETASLDVSEVLLSEGHEVSVIVFGDQQKIENIDGALVYRCRQLFKVISQPISADYFSYGIRLMRVSDVVHVHLPNYLALFLVLVCPLSTRIVVHWHSDELGFLKGILRFFLMPLLIICVLRSEIVIFTTEAYSRSSYVRRFTAKAKVRILKFCLPDLEKSTHISCDIIEKNTALELPTSSETVKLQSHILMLSVGRLVPYKGFYEAISTISNLPENLTWVIVGEGPLRAKLSQLIRKKGLQSRVHLLGAVTNSEKEKLFSSADIFALPSISRAEAFGVVNVEALRSGLPIVNFDILGSGVSEVCGDAGTNTKIKDFSAFWKSVANLSSSEDLRNEVHSLAIRRFSSEFKYTVFRDSLSKIYRELDNAC